MFSVVLLACTEAVTTPDGGNDDSGLSLRDLVTTQPAPAPDQHVFSSPVYTIEPYTEVMNCLVGTYTGETLGVIAVEQQQAEFGHHAQLERFDLSADVVPDGTVFDCLSGEYVTGGTMFESTQNQVDGHLSGSLPEGMAMYLEKGQRWVLQSHYANSSGDTLLVQDSYTLTTIPAEEVTEWAAPWQHGAIQLSVPPGVATQVVECTWDQDFTLLSAWGHMHEWGKSIRIEKEVDGVFETIYELEQWDPALTYAPEPVVYELGSLTVRAGERFRTWCTWDNNTGANLDFPSEMCVSLGVGYSSQAALHCDVPTITVE